MAVVRVPPNCSSITLTTSGVLSPSGNLITCTAAEATILTSPVSEGPGSHPVVKTAANGNVDMWMPSVVTSITIGGNVYAVSGLVAPAVLPADATAFILAMYMVDGMFQLVSG